MLTVEMIDAMRTTQAASMQDVVNITNRTLVEVYGEPTWTEVVQSGVHCGFDFTGGKEYDKGQFILVDYDANLRLPLDVEIGINDLVILVELAGESHDEEFEVFAESQFGVSVKHIQLKRRGN